MNRIVIAHAHIFKNAGTTLDWILERNFGQNFHDDRNDKLIRTDDAYIARLLNEKINLEAFASHSLPLPVKPVDGINLQVICLLRHPLLRVRSVYDFERKQQAETPGAKFAKTATFREYVQWRMLPEVNATIRDMQVRFITQNTATDKTTTDELLLLAKQYVEQNEMVGLVEQFDESMILFQERLSKTGVDFKPAYIKQNITEKKNIGSEEKLAKLRLDLGEGLYEVLLKKNQLDMALYEFAKNVFLERYKSLVHAEIKLKQLKQQCDKLSNKKFLFRNN